MIRRVFIKGYKSLKDVDLELKPLTVIIGPNASGKSNLLDALGLLSRIVTLDPLGLLGDTTKSGFIRSAFDEHRGFPLEAFSMQADGMEEMLNQEALQFTLGADMEVSADTVKASVRMLIDNMGEILGNILPPPHFGDTLNILKGKTSVESVDEIAAERFLRYEVAIEFVPSSGTLRLANERLVALRENGQEVEAEKAIYGVVLRGEFSRLGSYYLSPAAMRSETPLKEVNALGHDGRDLAGLFHTLKAGSPPQFDAVCRALPLLIPEVSGIDTEVGPDGMIRLIVTEGGTRYSSRIISDGTLRVLGLLAAVSSHKPGSTICFEEPENGVDPSRLTIVARVLETAFRQGKQIIVVTHSPRLIDYLYPANIEPEDAEQISVVSCWKEDNRTRFAPIFERLPFPMETMKASRTYLGDVLIRGDVGG